MCGDSCVRCFSRTKKCVPTPSAEAEYIILVECSKEAMFAYHALEFREQGNSIPPVVRREDDDDEICLAQNPWSSGRIMHIYVRYHYIGDLVKREKGKIEHVLSERQHADTSTKPLSLGSFRRLRNLLLNSRRES